MVAIVIFLKLNGLKLESSELAWRWKLVGDLLKLSAVIETRIIGIWILILLAIIS
jgi:hypothetical protein